MALHLEEVPEFRCTINLVPSLLAQLEGYVAGRDRHAPDVLAPARRRSGARRRLLPARQLLHGQSRFDDPARTRAITSSTCCAAVGRIRPTRPCTAFAPATCATFRSGPTWPGCTPCSSRRTSDLAEFKAKGRALHRGREAMAAGQAARTAGPGDPPAPEAGRPRPDRADHDAVLSPDPAPAVRQDGSPARRCPTSPCRPIATVIPRTPRSMSAAPWRATCATSASAATGHVAQRGLGLPGDASRCWPRHGIEWIATDEEILGCSTGGKVGRDSRGHVRHPELLYRAWKLREGDHELAIIFRDHSMSDQVGFHYQRSPGPERRGRLPGQAARHRRRLPAQPGNARPGHPGRRELLGILSRRRRLVSALALPRRGA